MGLVPAVTVRILGRFADRQCGTDIWNACRRGLGGSEGQVGEGQGSGRQCAPGGDPKSDTEASRSRLIIIGA